MPTKESAAEMAVPRSLFERHFQTVLLAIIVAGLGWIGNTAVQVREDVAVLKANDNARVGSIARLELNLAQVHTDILNEVHRGDEVNGKRIDRLEDLYRKSGFTSPIRQ